MREIILGYVASYGYVVGVMGGAQILEKRASLQKEDVRKIIHIFLVFTWLIMLHFLGGTYHMIIIPGTFVVLNLMSYLLAKKDNGISIPLLSRMERSDEEETPGTVYYAISMAVMAFISYVYPQMLVPCGMGLFCMAFGDGMAGVVGTRSSGIMRFRLLGNKSLGGSLACLLFASVGCTLLLLLSGYTVSLGIILIMGVFCMIMELPGHGLDNLTVPFGCMLMSSFLL